MSDLPLTDTFSKHYHASPEWLIQAPGRINLIGEHIDYLEGFVMPAAIDRYLQMAVRANGTDKVNVWSTERPTQSQVSFSLSDLTPFEGDRYWLNYIGGVIEMLRRDGIEPIGFDAIVTSSLPSGAGLSSSAALETASALALESVSAKTLDPVRRAELCQQAEHEFAGVPCGIMDQMAVGLGKENHALMLDCRDNSVSPVQIPKGLAIIVSDTRVSHALGDGEYKKRRESCASALQILNKPSWRDVTHGDIEAKKSDLGDLLFRRSRHVVSEIERVPQMSDALAGENLDAVAEIMKSGHQSLRDDYEVSCAELDHLVEAAYEFGTDQGLIGARMTGGGFGGSTVSLVREQAADELKKHLEQSFQTKFHSKPNCFVAQISDGASVKPVDCEQPK